MISIVNYEMGNIGSIINMFKRIGLKAELVNTSEQIMRANKLLLPGVGAFDAAMERINRSGLREPLEEKVLKQKVPLLGICLGMQLLTRGSEEGKLPGLGWIKAETKSFKKVLDTKIYKIPHMGWNEAKPFQSSPLTKGFLQDEENRFYFVHSFYVKCDSDQNSILKTEYGIEFDSGLQQDNIFGAQFHPEKSHKFGMKLLENFAKV